MNYKELSKTISHALRHEPEKYGLTISDNGWVEINELITGIKSYNTRFHQLKKEDIEKVVDLFEKKRHEIEESKIRALYGHSRNIEIEMEVAEPPSILYHGTIESNVTRILDEGIQKMGRSYVHLASSIEQAEIVAKRRKGEVAIFEIQAKEASKNGVNFYQESGVWLCKEVSNQYIRLIQGIKS